MDLEAIEAVEEKPSKGLPHTPFSNAAWIHIHPRNRYVAIPSHSWRAASELIRL